MTAEVHDLFPSLSLSPLSLSLSLSPVWRYQQGRGYVATISLLWNPSMARVMSPRHSPPLWGPLCGEGWRWLLGGGGGEHNCCLWCIGCGWVFVCEGIVFFVAFVSWFQTRPSPMDPSMPIEMAGCPKTPPGGHDVMLPNSPFVIYPPCNCHLMICSRLCCPQACCQTGSIVLSTAASCDASQTGSKIGGVVS